ncbi:SagB family peptide dehydrogenase [Hyalangium gracile]|uniref:SagB family peptide dehydrogenase n=1 Tax=Hyalangium gracile TaxID=394092 RepID=UPI001CD038CF|nr:SagB family peptide dehydrogenase [Hyalangium gracile]
MTAVLDALAAGGQTLDELAELAGHGGLTDAAHFHSLLAALRAHGAVARSLHLDGVLIARLSPEGTVSNRGSPRADARYQLSRFAFSRRVDEGSMLETPLSLSRVWMPTWHGPALLGALSTSRNSVEFAKVIPGIPGELTSVFLRMLLEAGVLVEVGAEGAPIEPEALVPWEFHDLLFHGWTRWGRHETGYGGATFRFRGKRPQPGRKPPPSGEPLRLERPDLSAVVQRDAPFTEVLERRRTVRNQGERPVTRAALGELLYRAVGLRHADLADRDQKEARPYPSGGAIYETEVYVLVHRCEGLEPGLYAYRLEEHALYRVQARPEQLERMLKLAAAGMIRTVYPQVVVVLTACFERMTWKYETMAYAAMLKHVGVIFQTLYLVATAMGLAPCALGSGAADLFARATGIDPLVEGSVGEFALGTRADAVSP